MLSFIAAHLNPLTLKRLRRFRRKKRAWYALWIMILLYALSLASELLCNDRPLYLRFNGHSYFPAFRFYPADLFLNNGRQTRTDYKRLECHPLFADNPDNRMIFPPIPFGPYESLSPESIPESNWAVVTLTPERHAGTLNIGPDFAIRRSTGCGFFFNTPDTDVAGLHLTNEWSLPKTLLHAIRERFANRPAERFAQTINHRTDPEKSARVTLSTFTPRSAPPQTVRLTLQEDDSPSSILQRQTLFFDAKGILQKSSTPFFSTLTEEQQSHLRSLAQASFPSSTSLEGSRPREPDLLIAGTRYSIEAVPNTVQWPYPPIRGHWMGIDSAGRDVLARILYGLRTSMTFGLLLVVGAMLLGTLAGAVQGYFAGRIDLTMQRLIEIWSALPFLYIMILIGSVYGRGFILLLICYGLFNWISISYYIRAEFLRLRHRAFVDAARCLGLPAHRIMFRHILPNAITPIITFFPFSLVGAIGSLAALDYLGFGLPPPVPSWGELFAQAQTFRWAWWLILYPALALFIVMLLGVFIGEGVRDAFDPKPVSRME
ncbi:MAG: ABC transporter permease subunit [Kiritimatiellae bacterium]|nr:ABC transporter permease subunit [Kiritimatiellia bacterium]MDD4735361.1 ABC transporter permease subunit [Kiritimatiellia bacterium]